MNAMRTAAVVLIVAATIGAGVRAGGAGEPASLRAPERLSETGLYSGDATAPIASANLPFEPQYPLWTDGAEKRRWIHLPPGSAIDATNTDAWVFPVGTKIWKEFAFEGRKVETRYLWRATSERWVFATYLWNDSQTEAFLVSDAGVRKAFVSGNGVMHSIPAMVECHACHGSAGSPVLGFTALQLSDDRDPLAPHAKPLDGNSLTIAKLDRAGLLRPARPDLVAAPPRIKARSPRERAALGYLSANCGSCHNERGPLVSLGLYLQHTSDVPVEPGFATTVGVPGEYVTPGAGGDSSRRIAPGLPDSSAIVYRMSSRRPVSQMPPLGTSVVDTQALELIRAWIAEDLAKDAGP